MKSMTLSGLTWKEDECTSCTRTFLRLLLEQYCLIAADEVSYEHSRVVKHSKRGKLCGYH